MLADLYGYTIEYSLYRLTFGQAMGLIETRNRREKKAQEAAKRDTETERELRKYEKEQPVEELPSLSDFSRVFGKPR